LGELVSFQITWDLSTEAAGTYNGNRGRLGLEIDGPLELDGGRYGLANEATQDGGGIEDTVSASIAVYDDSTFLVSDAGVGYNSELYDVVTGADSFTLSLVSPVYVDARDVGEVTLTTTGSVTLTYTYIAAAVPEPASYAAIFGGLALAGTALRRRPRALA
jgi:hypothetical protein